MVERWEGSDYTACMRTLWNKIGRKSDLSNEIKWDNIKGTLWNKLWMWNISGKISKWNKKKEKEHISFSNKMIKTKKMKNYTH